MLPNLGLTHLGVSIPPLVAIPDANLAAVVREALELRVGAPILPERMPSLTTLDASGREIADLTGLETATALTTLNVSNNAISNVTPLSGLTSLTSLDLSDNQIIDVAALSGLTSLLALNLSDNQIIDVAALSGLTSLLSLNLSENEITDVEPLSGLVNLGAIIAYGQFSYECGVALTAAEPESDGTGSGCFYTGSGDYTGYDLSQGSANHPEFRVKRAYHRSAYANVIKIRWEIMGCQDK